MFIFFFSNISWLGLHQRPHHIVRALANHYKVLWIEPATLLEQWHWKPTQVAQNIFVMSLPSIPYNARHAMTRFLAKSVSRIGLMRGIIKALQKNLVHKAMGVLGVRNATIGFIVHNFNFLHFTDALKPAVVLYDYIDNVFGFTSLPNHLQDEWVQTIRRADLITVTSPVLERQVRKYRNNDIYYVGNGVEYDVFSKSTGDFQSFDLPTGKPIIGYVGSVYPWLDYDLIKYVCTTMLEIDVVFIGRVHPDIYRLVEQLKQLPNIHFLGFKPYREIPSYLARFDVGIIPFQKNELTAAVNPVKLYEYSATGKPTVTTDFSEDVLQYKDTIFVARTREEFVSGVRRALEKSRDTAFIDSLKAFARQHDWSTKTSRIIELLNLQIATNQPS